jgi:phosphotriesterase-related protein
MRPTVMTVRGPIDPAHVGMALMHEHLLIDLSSVVALQGDPEALARTGAPIRQADLADIGWSPEAFFSTANADLSDVAVAAAEAREFAMSGGATIVELTPIGFRRDVRDLARIAVVAGLHVVAGSAFFSEASLPAAAVGLAVDGLASILIGEFEDGIDGTGIRPGIIGEIGTGSPVSEWEALSLRASVIAARRTGMAMSVHLERWQKEGLQVIDILEDAGADLSRVVIGHLNTTVDEPDYHLALARRGVVLGYDLCGSAVPRGAGRFPPRDEALVPVLLRLAADGHGGQVVLSHDLSFRTEYRRFGGRGYAHVPRRVLPLLLDAGIPEDMIDQVMRRTPMRLLTLAPDP